MSQKLQVVLTAKVSFSAIYCIALLYLPQLGQSQRRVGQMSWKFFKIGQVHISPGVPMLDMVCVHIFNSSGTFVPDLSETVPDPPS